MILLWLTLAVLLAGLIARYNQSNKLFWILFTSFVVGIAGGALYLKGTSHGKEQAMEMAQPIQGSTSYANVTSDVLTTEDTIVPDPVSKALPKPDSFATFPIVSKCCVDTSTPPPDSKPLQLCIDSLTHPN